MLFQVDPRAVEIAKGIADENRHPADGSGTGEAIYRLIEALEKPTITYQQFLDAVIAASKNTVHYAYGTSEVIPSEAGVLRVALEALGIKITEDASVQENEDEVLVDAMREAQDEAQELRKQRVLSNLKP